VANGEAVSLLHPLPQRHVMNLPFPSGPLGQTQILSFQVQQT
jgi:hypothetical protein